MEDSRDVPAGDLWREVVNFIRDRKSTPDLYMPLLEHVASRPEPRGWYLDQMAERLKKPSYRAEIEDEIGLANVGYRLWQEQSEAICRWADTSDRGPFPRTEVESWWLHDEKSRFLSLHERAAGRAFIDAVEFLPGEMPYVQMFLGDEGFHDIVVANLRRDLPWMLAIDWLDYLAERTWPADPKERKPWDQSDVAFVQEYYGEQWPELDIDGKFGEEVDPFALRPAYREQRLGMGSTELWACMFIVMRSTVIDFMNEILAYSQFPSAKGSLCCVECGLYAPRHPKGYGQLYCSDRCKKRAAKRRYRSQPKTAAEN